MRGLNSIIDMVKERLEQDGTTMESLADSFGMSRGSLYNKLSGKNHLLLPEAIRLAKWLGMSTDELGNAIYAAS